MGACELQPDISGGWSFVLSPVDIDGGLPTVPRDAVVTAQLEQVKPPGVLSLGRLVYGSLSSSYAGFFTNLEIPRLMNNGGSKTGSMLGCAIQLNLPLMMPVSDDNQDPGPLKLSLGGKILAAGSITGDPTLSSIILSEDAAEMPRTFAWTGTKL